MAGIIQTTSGKDKILRWTRFWLGPYDLSGDFRTFGNCMNSVDVADMTGVSQSMRWGMTGSSRHIGVQGVSVLMNDDTAKAFTILKNPPYKTYGVIVAFGGGGEPAVADPCYFIPSISLTDAINNDGGKHVIGPNFNPYAVNYIADMENPMGVLLAPRTSIAATTTFNTHDNGAATTNGCHAMLVIAAASGTAWTSLVVEDSADNTTYAALITFTITGNAVAAEHKAGARTTVERYVRFVATRGAASTITAICAFARN
jgi:hypothetical protein